MSTLQKSPGNRNSPKSHNDSKSPNSPGNAGNNLSITQSMSQVIISGSAPTQLATRPGHGTKGNQVKAKVNFYPIDLSKTPPIFDYTVTISSKDKKDDDIKSRARTRIIQLLLEKPAFKNAASDYSKRIVSIVQIKGAQGQDFTCTIDYSELEEKQPRSGTHSLQFKVSVKETGQFLLDTLVQHLENPTSILADTERYTSALNILFSRYYGQNTNMATSARRAKFFDVGPKRDCSNLTHSLDVVVGYFRAVKTTMNGLMLNVNTAAAVMYSTESLDKVIKDMASMYPDGKRQLLVLSGQLKGLRVTHQFFGCPTRKTVSAIAIQHSEDGRVKQPTAANITFLRDKNPKTNQLENKQISVAQHFRDAYPKTRRTNDAAWVVNLGSRDKPNYVPSDLLQVLPGNFYRGLVPHPEQGATMIRLTCRSPGANKVLIQGTGLKQLGIDANKANGPKARFNIVVSSDMLTVDARMLPAPNIAYGNAISSSIKNTIQKGSWNLRDIKFKTCFPAVKISWIEFVGDNCASALNFQEFKNGIERGFNTYCGRPTKMTQLKGFEHAQGLPGGGLNAPHMAEMLNAMKKNGIKLVFVVLPDKSATTYNAVKVAGDVLIGIHTICTVVKPGGKPKPKELRSVLLKAAVGEIGNLMMKVNMKLGGVNLAVRTDSKDILHTTLGSRIMFVGADVGHAAPGSMEGAPSIAGVVATTDQSCFRYAGSVRLQNHLDENKKSIEYVLQFEDMMVERLKLYQKRNNQFLPETIVVYRDGVADNMFIECVDNEVKQIKRACTGVYGNKTPPKLVFIVAQKRHHTRFYEDEGSKNGFDGNGNPKPGFIVDSKICDSRLWDWYLTSHICLKGTSRAAHYTVLHNETTLSADELQLLTHHQCWLLGRSSTSISIHPAARHADLLCDRARVYLRSVYVPKEHKEYVPQEHWPGNIHADLKDDVFWI